MKRVGALIFSAALLLALGAGAMAQVGLDLHGLYAFEFSDDDVDELDGAFGGGASLVFCMGEVVKLDLGGDYYKPKFKDFSGEKLQFIPVTGTLRVGIPIEDTAYLYVGGGAGYSFNEYTGEDDDWLELEDCFTYHACGGAELLFNENIGIRGEFRYIWMRPDLKEKIFGSKEEIKLDHMQVRGGLVFYF